MLALLAVASTGEGKILEIMTQAHVSELLGAFALLALEPDEMLAIQEHLGGCQACRAELEPVEEAVAALALSAQHSPLATSVKERLFARIAAEQLQLAQTASGPAVRLDRPKSQAVPNRLAWWVHWTALLRSPAAALALACLVLALGLGGYAWQAQRNLQSLRDAFAVLAKADQVVAVNSMNQGTEAQGTLYVSHSQNRAIFVAYQLPALNANQVYELWLIDGSVAHPAGTFRADAQQTALLPLSIAGMRAFQNVGVTIEPLAGSLVPTSPLIMLGKAGT